MKILMLAPAGSPHATRPLQWLTERGHHVTFMDWSRPSPSPTGDYAFARCPLLSASPLLGNRVGGMLDALALPRLLRHRWRRLMPDVVHVHWLDARAYYCTRAGLRPLVLSVWGSDVNSLLAPAADAPLRRQVGEALARADLVIADAPDMPDKCSRLAGRDVRVEMLPLGIPTRRFRAGYAESAVEWRRKLAIPPGATVLLSARAFLELYGHHLILEAFAQALPHLDGKAVLVLKTFRCGTASPDVTGYEAGLRRRADELNVSAWVRWLPEVPIEKLPEVYALSDVVLNFPRMDGFPVTFLEAAACERPVITCRLPSYAGTFAERYFNMVEPGNVAALSEAIVRYVKADARVRERWTEQARREVEQYHDEAVSASRLLQLYGEVITQAGPSSRGGCAQRVIVA